MAQNVNFDYSFIKKEYELLDRSFRFKRLCTSRYARNRINGLRSSSLKNLARYFDVVNDNPHRALSDALTAAYILIRLIELDSDLEIANELMNPQKSKVTLPVNVDTTAQLRYQIFARDLAGQPNSVFSPESGFYNIEIVGVPGPIAFYQNDFDNPSDDFFGEGFTIETPNGFESPAIHS